MLRDLPERFTQPRTTPFGYICSSLRNKDPFHLSFTLVCERLSGDQQQQEVHRVCDAQTKFRHNKAYLDSQPLPSRV